MFFFFQKNFLGGYMVTFAFKQVKSTIIEVTFGLHEVTKNQKASIYNNFEKIYRLHFRIKSQLDQLFFKTYIKYTYPYFYTI